MIEMGKYLFIYLLDVTCIYRTGLCSECWGELNMNIQVDNLEYSHHSIYIPEVLRNLKSYR